MEEPLSKDLLTGHFSTRLDADGTLTIVEKSTGYNALEEEVTEYTELVMPAKAVRGLRRLLNRKESRRRIGARQVR